MTYQTIPGTKFHAFDYQRLLGPKGTRLPYSLRVLAENAGRHSDGGRDTCTVAARDGSVVPFRPARLLLQDMLGVPVLVDIMAMRDLLADHGVDPTLVDMSLPVDLVIDHAITIEHWAEPLALERNMAREFEVNRERFAFLKACAARFPRLRVIPPGGGICHQVNLEYLAKTVLPAIDNPGLLIPDSCLGTDSHTTMINALGVTGWGIGGLEAEGLLFGETTAINVPKVIGLEVTGAPSDDITATDIALVVTERLRTLGVIDCFIEMFGSGYSRLGVADRATIANMAPEYGSTQVFCPVDTNTLRYLRETGRGAEAVHNVEAYCKTQAMWAEGAGAEIDYDVVVTLDLGRIGRSVSGPARPEQRLDLAAAAGLLGDAEEADHRVPVGDHDIGDGDVVIAAITSCTNTANPRNMVLAGLMARNAVRRGLAVKPHVKTSLSPGSRVVARYLDESGLQADLDALGFALTAFACSTCNGMSGPLRPEYEAAITEHGLKAVAVLSGNRNFAGRIHPLAARNVIAAPPLVIAYALAGTILKDITTEPLGLDRSGAPVMLSDLWPSAEEVDAIIAAYLTPEQVTHAFEAIEDVNPDWSALEIRRGRYEWPDSTYVGFPPFLRNIPQTRPVATPLLGLRPLVILGDSVTTDHISPSGTITPTSDAGKFLLAREVPVRDFNSFGTRRGCPDVVIRSTFANNRLRNEMVPGKEGSWTTIQPEGTEASVFGAIETYLDRGQKLVVIGGRNYGCGSSRDTAAKAPWLAGVRAVIAESFERIHRSNLVNMGIAPLTFPAGVTRRTLALDGTEVFDIQFTEDLSAAALTVHRRDGGSETVPLDPRLYNEREREIFAHGGLLPMAFRAFLDKEAA
ncbi:MAG: aconitate hydratase AcnA [Rhodospirillum sp.]|nr:aconitate hydratase AcnA [Rhodospirillum sp.]